MDTAVKPRYD
ncbi:MAG: hypothetical protein JW882_14550 [Deltaproteobacteria bacterium]|nr:hypothetical protein [Deltaproteobacteria bacterium]